jgi:hypothetical protein
VTKLSYNIIYTTPSTDRLKITSTSIFAPSGSMTRVGVALLLWVWDTAQTREHHTGVSHCEMSCKINTDSDGGL